MEKKSRKTESALKTLHEKINPLIYNHIIHLLQNNLLCDEKLDSFRKIFNACYPQLKNEFEIVVRTYNLEPRNFLYSKLIQILRGRYND
jgi:hypothetical protein